MNFLLQKIRIWLAVCLCTALWIPFILSAAFLITKRYFKHFNVTNLQACLSHQNPNSENLEQMTGQDLLWIEDSNKNRLYYSYVVYISEWIDIDKIRERIQIELLQAVDDSGILIYPKLTKYAVNRCDKWYWKTDDNFCAERHIFEHQEVDEECLMEAVNEVEAIPFVNNKPHWMIASVPYSLQDGSIKSILVFRFHHCIGDQFNIQKMVAVSLSDRVYNLNAMTPLEKARELSIWLRMYAMFKVVFMYPFRVMVECIRREETPLTLVYLEKKKIYAWSPKINLNLIKTIKITSKTSINCVLITCLAETLKRHFRRCGITDSSTLTASLLFPYKNELELHNLQNQISLQLLALVMDKPNRLETLKATKEEVMFSKLYAKNVLHYSVTNVLMKCIPIDLINWAFDRVECSLTLMNVPIVADEVTLFETAVEDIILLNPYRGTSGASFTFVTYKDSLRVGATINSGIVPNLSQLDQILRDYRDEVYRLAHDVGINV